MKHNSTRHGSLVLALLLAAAIMLGSCSPNGSADAGGSPADAAEGSSYGSEAPFRIEIMTRYHTAEVPGENNKAIAAIEKMGNYDLDITWIAQDAYGDKANVTIAAGDYPMVMLSPSRAVEVEAVRAGMFWKVGDYLQNFDMLKNLSPVVIANAGVDGELWGLYRTRPLVRTGWFYRSDWMEKLGLATPKNPDELRLILKAFIENDPDGNGVADSGGLALRKDLGRPIEALAPYFGLPNEWGVEDGKLIPVQLMPGYFDVIRLLRAWYEEGLTNSDFPTVSEGQRDEMMGNNYGWTFDSIDTGKTILVSLQAAHPGGNFSCGVNFADSPSDKVWGRTGYDSLYYVSTKAVPQEADFLKIMEYFNLMHTPVVCNLLAYGIEGEHYDKVDDNTISITDDQKTLFLKEIEVVEQLGFRYTINNYDVADMPSYQAEYEYYFNDRSDLAIANPVASFISETRNEIGSDLNTFINDLNTKFITGTIDEASWHAGIEEWLELGGSKVIEEYQVVYDSLQ